MSLNMASTMVSSSGKNSTDISAISLRLLHMLRRGFTGKAMYSTTVAGPDDDEAAGTDDVEDAAASAAHSRAAFFGLTAPEDTVPKLRGVFCFTTYGTKFNLAFWF